MTWREDFDIYIWAPCLSKGLSFDVKETRILVFAYNKLLLTRSFFRSRRAQPGGCRQEQWTALDRQGTHQNLVHPTPSSLVRQSRDQNTSADCHHQKVIILVTSWPYILIPVHALPIVPACTVLRRRGPVLFPPPTRSALRNDYVPSPTTLASVGRMHDISADTYC